MFCVLFVFHKGDDAAGSEPVGGELVLENLPFFDRMIMKQVAKDNGELPEMHVDVVALDALVGAMR